MELKKKSPFDCTVAQLDQELLVRGALLPPEQPFLFLDETGTPGRNAVMTQIKELYLHSTTLHPNPSLAHISTQELIEILLFKTRNPSRGIWGKDQRRDCYEIYEDPIKRNANSVAAICYKDDLVQSHHGCWELKVKTFGPAFNLCPLEPFFQQPIATGSFYSGFLVAKDVIATAGHCVTEKNVANLRFIFGYRMLDSHIPATQIPENKVYHGANVIARVCNHRHTPSDWALVKLDRPVEGLSITKLSNRPLENGDSVYVMGHPCGLPLKYAPGARVGHVNDIFFTADLDIYCGSSGSPVFNSITHQVVGIVVRGDDRDFRWSGKCWVSVIYQNSANNTQGAQCTKVTEFLQYCL
jgi:V8-like Glu-specific endopeptidase